MSGERAVPSAPLPPVGRAEVFLRQTGMRIPAGRRVLDLRPVLLPLHVAFRSYLLQRSITGFCRLDEPGNYFPPGPAG